MSTEPERQMLITGRRRRRFADARDLLAGVGLLTCVGVLDWYTGPGVDFSLFYLLPVCFLTWRRGGQTGYVTSFVAASLWLCVDDLTDAQASHGLLAAWNIALRALFFAGVVRILESRKIDESQLTRLVEERTSALRAMALQLTRAEEAERRKLAHEIHDSVSQALTIIKINLDSAQLDARDPALAGRLGTASAMLEGVIKQTRTLMFDLHPAMLEDLGLAATLRWFGGEFQQRMGVDMLISEHGVATGTLSAANAGYLYRAVRELAANAVRHGRAKAVIVTLNWSEGSVRLTVDDDGMGFDPAVLPAAGLRGSFGLAGIDDRVRSMGGSMAVESTVDQGTRVVLEVPLSAQTNDATDATARLAG